jgi:hypothetical protein
MIKKKKENRGGWRDGGRPKKYNEPTKTLSIRVPESRYIDIKERVATFVESLILQS